MTSESALLAYVLRLGDNGLITGQRMIERVTQEAELEEELGNANFALDYIGQARMFYSYAGELEGQGRDEDDFAFLRPDHEFCNFLLAEQPNGHFGDAIVRQVLFESFYVLQLAALVRCRDTRVAAVAARAEKEIRYHLRHATQWLIRLGKGTELSHSRVQASLDRYWPFTGEFFAEDDVDRTMKADFGGPDLDALRVTWRENVDALIRQSGLDVPADRFLPAAGREGRHSEHFGFLIAEMQHLQRAYPGASW